MLISHGAQIDARNNYNQTALMLAVQNGSKNFEFRFILQTKKKIQSKYTL